MLSTSDSKKTNIKYHLQKKAKKKPKQNKTKIPSNAINITEATKS